MTTEYAVERWLDEARGGSVGYSGYWNDPVAERGKPFDVADGDYGRLERYLGEVGLTGDLRHCLSELDTPLSGTALDVAAGTLWAVPILLEAGAERVYCVEYSEHRLLEIGPQMLRHYGVAPDRVVLAYGSFYDLRMEDGSCSLAFLSQAFHHADDPEALLGQLAGALRPGGVAIIVGEHVISPRDVALYSAKAVLSLLPGRVQRRLMAQPLEGAPRLRPAGSQLVPVDPVMGDHVYTRAEYGELFSGAGFAHRRLRRKGSPYQSFLLERLA